MSRSNPQENAPNPAVRWFEWNGEHGNIRYYDKSQKKNVDVDLPFTFLLLDELGTVRGWHEPSKSGIYANEVRDTRNDVLIVKSFKGGTLAEGFYKDIKDRIARVGGHFTANCYIAFKQADALVIGSVQFKGAALGAWMEFRKEHRTELFEKAVVIDGYREGKKGRIIYRMPVFTLKSLSSASNTAAIELDRTLQEWLKSYLSRTTHDRAAEPPADTQDSDELDYDELEDRAAGFDVPSTADDIPF